MLSGCTGCFRWSSGSAHRSAGARFPPVRRWVPPLLVVEIAPRLGRSPDTALTDLFVIPASGFDLLNNLVFLSGWPDTACFGSTPPPTQPCRSRDRRPICHDTGLPRLQSVLWLYLLGSVSCNLDILGVHRGARVASADDVAAGRYGVDARMNLFCCHAPTVAPCFGPQVRIRSRQYDACHLMR